MSLYAVWNGKLVESAKISISPDNRSFKYGDGCFETIKVIRGNIILADLHFQRLLSSLQSLKLSIPPFFTQANITDQVKKLLELNNHDALARVRLIVYAGDGALHEVQNREINYIIQSWTGNSDTNFFNVEGLKLDIFEDAKKNADKFSSVKSNNYLTYTMAAIWSVENELDDCLLTNSFDQIVEASIANVFIIKNGVIRTPALTEGCVNGVMRKHLLHCFGNTSIPFHEGSVTRDELLNASEVFLTNANYGLRWVARIGETCYQHSISKTIHQKFVAPLFSGTTF